MIFSSVLFLFRFLPLFMAVYFMAPKRMKNFVLLVGSLFFYAWGEPEYVILMVVSILFHYASVLLMERCLKSDCMRGAKIWITSILCIDIFVLALFKYSGFLPLPIGISFYTFQAISYSIDVYRKDSKAEKNLIIFASYITMFPQLIAGPILQYKSIEKEFHERSVSWEDIFCGIRCFIIGLSKKVLLANNAGLLWDQIKGQVMYGSSLSMMTAWLGVVLFAFQIYFDFSGYSDMAMGLGRMMGFHFIPNFRYPYLARSVTEFFRRWHISLGSWFRDYVYIPLGGSRKGIARQIFNLLIVWALTGIWHGAGLPFLCWGLWFWVLLVIEKVLKKAMSDMGRIDQTGGMIRHLTESMRWLYTMMAVLIGWCIFESPDLNFLILYLKCMFIPQKLTDPDSMYLLMENRSWLIIMTVAATPFGTRIRNRLRQLSEETYFANRIYFTAETVIMGALMILNISYLVSESYNPFLYFRF